MSVVSIRPYTLVIGAYNQRVTTILTSWQRYPIQYKSVSVCRLNDDRDVMLERLPRQLGDGEEVVRAPLEQWRQRGHEWVSTFRRVCYSTVRLGIHVNSTRVAALKNSAIVRGYVKVLGDKS